MDKIHNDVLIKIITTISEDKNKEIFDLQNKLKELHTDLEKEKLKISNIKDITYFYNDLFCCDFCCKVHSWNEISPMTEMIDRYICVYCDNDPIYTEDILKMTQIYVVKNITPYRTPYYSSYYEIPKRYKHNPIFTIKKYYYNDIDSIFEDISCERSYQQAEIKIIKKGHEVHLDYRNNIYFEDELKQKKTL